MAFITAETRSDIIALVVTMLDRAPDDALLNELVTASTSGKSLTEIADMIAAKDEFTEANPASQTAEEYATAALARVLDGTGVSAAVRADAIDLAVSYLNDGMTKAGLALEINNYLAQPSVLLDANFGDVAQTFVNKNTVAEYYVLDADLGDLTTAELTAALAGVTAEADSVTAATDAADATAAAEEVVPGQTFTLTTGVDASTGSAGDDSFTGVLQAAGAAGSTASPGDSVKGGEGSDTFSLSVAGDAGGAHTLQAVQLDSVENVLVTNFDLNAAATTIDTSLMSGVEKIGLFSSSATGDTVFSGMKSITDAQMSNGSGDLTLTYVGGVTGTADTQNLHVSAVTGGTFTANGLETVAITGSLAASKLTNIAGSTLKKISVDGDQNFTLATATTVKTIDASANSGKTSLILGAANQTVTLGSGDDTVDVSTNLTYQDKIQGGEGTDTIKISAAGTINGPASAADITAEFLQSGGFEVIDIASTNDAATLALAKISGVETVKAAANVRTVTFVGDAGAQAAAADIDFTLNGTALTSVADLSGNAAADQINAAAAVAATIDALSGFSASSDGVDTVTITRTGGEIVEIAVTDQVGATATEADYSDVTVSGVTDQNIDIFSADKVTARLADSSGEEDSMTVNLKSLATEAAVAQTIGELDIADSVETLNLVASGMKTGTSAVQKTLTTLTADASLTALNISGSDKLAIGTTTASKLATIDASAATGDISLPSVANLAQTITTGSGNDTITMGANLTAADVIDTGANSALATGRMGTDTVSTTANQGSAVSAAALQISNAEAIAVSLGGGALDSYIDGSKLNNVGAIAFASGSGQATLTNMPAGVGIGLGINDGESTATYTYKLADSSGSEDALTLTYGTGIDASTSNTIVASGIETLNVVASSESANAETSSLVLTNMTASTINVTGGHSGDTTALGTLNKAAKTVNAGATKAAVSLTSATGYALDVSAPAAVANNIALSTKADTVTLTGKLGTTIQVITGGATVSASTSDTLSATLTSTASDFTSISGFEVVNLTVPAATATGFDDAVKNDGVENASVVNILGGNANSTFVVDNTAEFDRNKTSSATAQTVDASGFNGTVTLNFGSDDLDIFTTVKGGSSSSDHVLTTISAAASSTAGNNPTMSGIEQLTVESTDGDADAVINLGGVTGLTRVNAILVNAAQADQIEIDKMPEGVPVYVQSNNAGDNLDVGLASASGSSDSLTIVTQVGNGGLNLDAAGVESLSIVNAVSQSYDLAGVSPTTGAETTVTLTSAGNATITALNTGITTIDASALAGQLSVSAAARDADAITIKGGVNNDSIAMENAADALDGGSQAIGGGDTLVVNYAAVLGGLTADLSADDQIVSVDGSPNAAVQTGFENIDLRAFSGFGSVVTGSDAANTITGTAGVDRIIAGKGNDTIQVALTNDANTDQVNGGAGTDTLTMLAGDYVPAGDDNLTGVEVITSAVASVLNLSTQSEGLTITGAAGIQNITGGTGADTLTGGAAADNFNFDTGATGITVATADTITDFVTAVDTITTNFAAADTTENDDGAAADFAAVVVLAEANFAGTVGVGDDVYVSIDAFGSGDAYVFIDEDASDTLSAGDTVIILTGVNLVAEFDAATDIL